jgi:hypothetical protein
MQEAWDCVATFTKEYRRRHASTGRLGVLQIHHTYNLEIAGAEATRVNRDHRVWIRFMIVWTSLWSHESCIVNKDTAESGVHIQSLLKDSLQKKNGWCRRHKC